MKNWDWKKLLPKINWKALLVFWGFFLVFFLIDFLTKTFLFKTSEAGGEGTSHGFIGFRSFAHDNSTLFSFLNISMPLGAKLFVNFFLLSIFLVASFYIQNIFYAIGLGVLFSGMFGNTLDIIISKEVSQNGVMVKNYVKDIIFTPWFDHGTFNFADTFVISGVVFFAGSMFWFQFKESREQRKREEA